jgi:hypothetical protein
VVPPVPEVKASYKSPGVTAGVKGVRDRFETARFTSFDSWIVLAGAILFYFAVVTLAASRQLWFDELFTYYIAKSPSLHRLWESLRLDLNPPLSYLAARASLKLFGDSAVAVRLPFMLAFLAGSLCFYRFVSRRLRPIYGLLAVLVFWSTPFLPYATEARPYAFIFCFFGMAMLAWQCAIEPARPRSALVYLGLAVSGMMVSHFFALFYLAPFVLAELLQWYRSRTFDWPVWVALLAPCMILVAFLPTITRYKANVLVPPSFEASPIRTIGMIYRSLQPESLALLLAICVALLLVFRRSRVRTDTRALMTPVELVFTAGLFVIPVLVNLAIMRSHGATFERYIGPVAFAFGLLIPFFVAMYSNVSRVSAAVACCILLLYIGALNLVAPLRTVWRTSRSEASVAQSSPFQQIYPDLPLVAASGLTFLQMDKYADLATVSRLYYLTDREFAIRYAHATIFEGFSETKQYFPIRAAVDPYPQFVAAHPRFLVFGTPDYPEDWLIRRLLDIHASLRFLGEFNGPYKDRDLYLVTMPNE